MATKATWQIYIPERKSRTILQTTANSAIRNLIQIAGVIDQDEARLLVECGVDHLGFPLRLPVHQEDLSTEEAGRIMRLLPAPARGVLITYLDKAAEIGGTPIHFDKADPVQQIKELRGGQGVDKGIDAVGYQAANPGSSAAGGEQDEAPNIVLNQMAGEGFITADQRDNAMAQGLRLGTSSAIGFLTNAIATTPFAG